MVDKILLHIKSVFVVVFTHLFIHVAFCCVCCFLTFSGCLISAFNWHLQVAQQVQLFNWNIVLSTFCLHNFYINFYILLRFSQVLLW